MARLYSNENFPLPVVEQLRLLGHDVSTVQETRRTGDSDPEVIAFAMHDNRAVLTLNRRDFVRLHSVQPVHAGIIVCSSDSDFIGQAQRIHEAIHTISDLAGQLIRVNRPANS